MPTATSFTALGKGNGLPFCIINATDSVINALNGHEDKIRNFVSGAVTVTEVYRVREVTLTEAMGYIWNLYQVSFADFTETSTGNVISFYTSAQSDPLDFYGVLRYESSGEAYLNSEEFTPLERVCNGTLDFPIPRNTFPPFDNGDGGVFFAEAKEDPGGGAGSDFSAQFAIRSINYATDTQKYYMIYTLSLRDGGSFVEEMPFSGLTFNYYTYS